MVNWYNDEKLKKYAPDASINFIVGQRRIGKTFFFQIKAIENFEKDGSQTLWLRNKKVEFQPPFPNDFLNGLKSIGMCQEDYTMKADGIFYKEETPVVKFASISTFSNLRGNAQPDINMIVFDEFMPEDRRYPRSCHTGLLSITKTILSGKENAKVYCLSNFISAANPYFVGFGIYPNEKFDVTNFKDKGIAIEVCRGYNCAISDNNKWNKVYDAGAYKNYSSVEEDSMFSLISQYPNDAIPGSFCIIKDGVIYGYGIKDGLVYWHEINKPTNRLYAVSLQDTSDKFGLLPDYLFKFIKDSSNNNIQRFTTPNVMYGVLSILYNEI